MMQMLHGMNYRRAAVACSAWLLTVLLAEGMRHACRGFAILCVMASAVAAWAALSRPGQWYELAPLSDSEGSPTACDHDSHHS